MNLEGLTAQRDWDQVWADITLPLVYDKRPAWTCISTTLKVFDKWLPRTPGISVLEIGGAVGGYLAYMHKNFGYQVSCLDYSQVGCAKTRENFRLLGIKGRVIQGDLFGDVPITESFDIVYSMGFVEHFPVLEPIVERHLKFLKPGGILIIGVPNYLGINHWLAGRLAPRLLSQHNLSAMEISKWASFEKKFGLKKLFKRYVGGFIPTAYGFCENPTFVNRVIDRGARLLSVVLLRYLPVLRRFNARCVSCYALGIWKKP
jgi:SAM-dependent methyltransferase